MTVINRTQALVLGFFVLAWVALITILVVAPEVYDRALRQAPGSQPAAEIVFVAGLSGLIAVVCVGVVRRRRRAFWLTLTAFFARVLRVPAAALQLAGICAGRPHLVCRPSGRDRRGAVRHRCGDARWLSPLRDLGSLLNSAAPQPGQLPGLQD
jgi:hypothetical protein